VRTLQVGPPADPHVEKDHRVMKRRMGKNAGYISQRVWRRLRKPSLVSGMLFVRVPPARRISRARGVVMPQVESVHS
jgi:hypothetical protein